MAKHGRRRKCKLDFFRESFITDIPKDDFKRALPYIHECMPRIYLTMTDEQLHSVINALAYMAAIYTPWPRIEHFKTVQRCYYRFKKRHYLAPIRKALGLQRLDPVRPERKSDPFKVVTRRRRKCPECPGCGLDMMKCYGTHRQGYALVRHYRCESCGHTAIWITTELHQWWRNPRPFKNNPTVC